jgi:hypothetical protein
MNHAELSSKSSEELTTGDEFVFIRSTTALHTVFACLSLAACQSLVFLVDYPFRKEERDSLASAENNCFQVACQIQGAVQFALEIERPLKTSGQC